MARLPIKIYPDPILKQKASPVTVFDAKLKKLLDDMAETMYEAHGVGLAANQIGSLERIVVVDVSEDRNELLHLINPEILNRNGKKKGEEGCLSIPGFRDNVERSSSLTLRAQDATGKQFEIEADGLLAVCIQHEIDHLDGILFVDRLSRLKREFFKKWLEKEGPLENTD